MCEPCVRREEYRARLEALGAALTIAESIDSARNGEACREPWCAMLRTREGAPIYSARGRTELEAVLAVFHAAGLV